MSALIALDSAIAAAGGNATEFASKIGSNQSTVSMWRHRLSTGSMSVIPAEYCPAIERETGVRCELLNPSVDWPVLRRRTRPAKAAA
jgi:DNA-binding transcriptional regulator YdaS (Cro superfamily)